MAAVREAEAPQGAIRISMPAGIADALLIPMLSNFLERYPSLSIEAVATDRILDIAAERIDVAFRIGGIADGAFIARVLHQDANIFVASPAYLARAQRIAVPADLAAHPLIGFTAFGSQQSFRLDGPDGSQTEIEIRCRVTTTSGLAIKHWVLAGAGIARYPRSVVESELRTGLLIDVTPGYTNGCPQLSAVYMPERFRPANTRRLIEHAVDYYRNKIFE
jgi:DNA-binding transcriptional LysR family regulator